MSRGIETGHNDESPRAGGNGDGKGLTKDFYAYMHCLWMKPGGEGIWVEVGKKEKGWHISNTLNNKYFKKKDIWTQK